MANILKDPGVVAYVEKEVAKAVAAAEKRFMSIFKAHAQEHVKTVLADDKAAAKTVKTFAASAVDALKAQATAAKPQA